MSKLSFISNTMTSKCLKVYELCLNGTLLNELPENSLLTFAEKCRKFIRVHNLPGTNVNEAPLLKKYILFCTFTPLTFLLCIHNVPLLLFFSPFYGKSYI